MIPKLIFNSPLSEVTRNFLVKLRHALFSGDIEDNPAQRLLMSTDNSVYQVLPEVVLFPRHTADIQKIFSLSTEGDFETLSFALRGGGTATNGQSLCAGIIIDCSRYMNTIKDVNIEEQWVVVECGVVLDELNRHLKKYGYFFPVNISTGSQATLGGMASTNACGKGASYYGRMSDNVLEVSSVLSDGTLLKSQIFSREAVTALEKKETRLARIVGEVSKSVSKNDDEIKALYPELVRTVTGYTLSEVYDAEQKHLNLNAILIGSEGTLAAMTELKLKISRIPEHKLLAILQYSDFFSAIEEGAECLHLKPTAIETIDEKILALAKTDILFPLLKQFIVNPEGDVGAITLIECVADDPVLLEEKHQQLNAFLNQRATLTRLSYTVITNPQDMRYLWELRKKSVGLLGRYHVNGKVPISGVEDTLVPPQKLVAFLKEFRQILDELKVTYGMFGHVDAGCVHVRPAFDLENPDDEAIYFKLIDTVEKMVRRHGGILWGEHGKGFRSQFVPGVFGKTLFQVLCDIKKIWDPNNRLNPGKIAVPSGLPEELIPLDSPPTRGKFNRAIHTGLKKHFHMALQCNGNGACFNEDRHEMICPSYKVTRDRVHSPKGRASLMREWLRLLSLQGSLKKEKKYSLRRDPDYSHEVYRAMQGCLGCGSCATQCPVQVDVPALKAEFLKLYHTRYRRSLRDKLVARSERIAFWQSKMPRFSHLMFNNRLSRLLCQRFLGLEALPSLSYPNFVTTCKKIKIKYAERVPLMTQDPDRRVVLLQDWVSCFYEAEAMMACYQLFQKLGFDVLLKEWFENGKTWHAKGYLNHFEEIAITNTQSLKRFSERGIPIVGLDPSITLTYRQEYPRFVPEAKQLNVLLPQEFLMNQSFTVTAKPPDKEIVLFLHCTEKTSAQRLQDAWRQLFERFGMTVTFANTGCCGMAGIYGHEREHSNHSRQLFAMSWAQYLQKEAIILATGYSCRSQIRRLKSKKVLHPIQFLRDSMQI